MACLFVPGPAHSHPQALAARIRPMANQPQAAEELIARMRRRLPRTFKGHRAFIMASSGSGLREVDIRTSAYMRLLVSVYGVFSERWYDVTLTNATQSVVRHLAAPSSFRMSPLP